MFSACTGMISPKYFLAVAIIFHYFISAPIWFLFSWFCFHTITSHLFPFFFIFSHVVAIITCQYSFLFFLFKNVNFWCPGWLLKVQVLEVFHLPLSIKSPDFFCGDDSGICNNQQHNGCWGSNYRKFCNLLLVDSHWGGNSLPRHGWFGQPCLQNKIVMLGFPKELHHFSLLGRTKYGCQKRKNQLFQLQMQKKVCTIKSFKWCNCGGFFFGFFVVSPLPL